MVEESGEFVQCVFEDGIHKGGRMSKAVAKELLNKDEDRVLIKNGQLTENQLRQLGYKLIIDTRA